MKPTHTLYRLSEPGDVHACRALWMHNQDLFGRPGKLGWPTIVAERNGVILGFLSTFVSPDFIAAGPLILRKTAAPLVALRLIEAYEEVLKLAKVTTYFYHIDAKNQQMIHLMEHVGYPPIETSEAGNWYKRDITNGIGT